MSECWKCQKPTPEGVVECDACANGVRDSGSRDEIDWNKVRTLADFRLIIEATSVRLYIHRGADVHRLLKKFF